MSSLPSITYPSHGGVNNPNWRFRRGADLHKTLPKIKRTVINPARTRLALVMGKVIER